MTFNCDKFKQRLVTLDGTRTAVRSSSMNQVTQQRTSVQFSLSMKHQRLSPSRPPRRKVIAGSMVQQDDSDNISQVMGAEDSSAGKD